MTVQHSEALLGQDNGLAQQERFDNVRNTLETMKGKQICQVVGRDKRQKGFMRRVLLQFNSPLAFFFLLNILLFIHITFDFSPLLRTE